MVEAKQMQFQKSIIREEYVEEQVMNQAETKSALFYKGSPRRKRLMKKMILK